MVKTDGAHKALSQKSAAVSLVAADQNIYEKLHRKAKRLKTANVLLRSARGLFKRTQMPTKAKPSELMMPV